MPRAPLTLLPGIAYTAAPDAPRTPPHTHTQIVYAGSFVGGCNDGPGVVPLNKDGKLVPLLKQAGAMR